MILRSTNNQLVLRNEDYQSGDYIKLNNYIYRVGKVDYRDGRGKTLYCDSLNYIPNPPFNGSIIKIEVINQTSGDIKIGRTETGEDAFINSDYFFTHVFVCGKTGSGKSTTVKRVLKQMRRNVGIFILDTHGEYLEAAVRCGKAVNHVNAETQDSVPFRDNEITILDMKTITLEKKRIYAAYLLDYLFNLRKANKLKDFLIICDEAQNYAPQGEKAESKDILKTIAAEGRKFGLGLICSSQRPASLDKNIISQCAVLIAHKLTNEGDINQTLRNSQGSNKSMGERLTFLNVGEAYISSPELSAPVKVKVDM